MLLLLQFQKKVPKHIQPHHHHHHHIDGVDIVACATVVFSVSTYEYENAAMKGVKTHLSIGKMCYEIRLKIIENGFVADVNHIMKGHSYDEGVLIFFLHI